MKQVDANIYGIKRDIERSFRRRRIALKRAYRKAGSLDEEIRLKPRYNRAAEKANWREEAQEHLP